MCRRHEEAAGKLRRVRGEASRRVKEPVPLTHYRNTAREFSQDMRSLGGAQASADAIIKFLEK
jgi:hypothetical protein